MLEIQPQSLKNSARIHSECMGRPTSVHLIHSIDLNNPETITTNVNTLMTLINRSAERLIQSAQNQTPYDYKLEEANMLAITQSLGSAYEHFKNNTISTLSSEYQTMMSENYSDLLNALATFQNIVQNVEKSMLPPYEIEQQQTPHILQIG